MMYRLDFAEEVLADDKAVCREMIADELSRIESTFSLYRDTSELSRWNADRQRRSIGVSDDLLALAERSQWLWQVTEGAFDPTVRPLMQLWNWDELSGAWSPPSEEEVATVLKQVGWKRIEIDSGSKTIRKREDHVEIDFNALVEGWTIDRIVKRLREKGHRHFLFQLGGEYFGSGYASGNQPWTIGIESPGNSTQLVGRIELIDQALSVSGSYRSGRFQGARWYSHILDPRTGFPSRSIPCSVAVTSHSAFEADGWATALMIVERTKAIDLADRQRIVALFADSVGGKTTVETSRLAHGVFITSPPHEFERLSKRLFDSGPTRMVLGFFAALIGILFIWRVVRQFIREGRPSDTI